MTLDEYLKKNGLTDEAFAEAARLSQPYVNRLRRGEATKPSARTQERIYEATAGEVTANDLLGMKPAERASEARQ